LRRRSLERWRASFAAQRRGGNLDHHRPRFAGARKQKSLDHRVAWITVRIRIDDTFDQRRYDGALSNSLLSKAASLGSVGDAGDVDKGYRIQPRFCDARQRPRQPRALNRNNYSRLARDPRPPACHERGAELIGCDNGPNAIPAQRLKKLNRLGAG
jgi:hypothetical protein